MKPDEFKMRPVEPADNLQLADLIKKVMNEFTCIGEGYSINDPEVDEMYEAYEGERHGFWVIESGDRILGCGGVGPLVGADPSICELKKMYFYPELRGLGWGKKLMNLCLETAREFGYRTCYLETVERMDSAIGLYLKSGFSRLDAPLGATGHNSCEAYFAIQLDQ